VKEILLELVWNKRIKEDINDVAISTSGDCIIMSASGHIYCFDKKGKVSWEYETKEIDKGFDILMSSNEDNILASIYPKYKYVRYILDKSGVLISKYEGDPIHHFDVSLSNGYAVVSTKDNKIFLFDKNKNKLWEYTTDSKAITYISHSGEYIVAGSEKGIIYFFNKDGKLLWERNLKSNIFKISLSSDGKYLAICSGEKKDELYFFDNEGKLLWDYKNELIDIKIEGVSPSGQCIITGSKLTTPNYDKMIIIEGREYMIHVQDAYTTQICYFENNEMQWKLEGDEYRLSFSDIVISPEFEYIGLTVKVYQTANRFYYEIWFMDKYSKILWKYVVKNCNAYVKSITKKGEFIVALDGDSYWYLFNKNGRLLFKDPFLFLVDENSIKYPNHDEYTDLRISTNGKYIVTQYGNSIRLFMIKNSMIKKHKNG